MKTFKAVRKEKNTTGDMLYVCKNFTTGEYKVIGERINYVRGKNIVRLATVKDGLTKEQANKLFEKKVKGKRV
jgi:hypothetical protein